MKERIMKEIVGIPFEKSNLESFRTKRKEEKKTQDIEYLLGKRIIEEIAGITSSVWSTKIRREEQKFNLEEKIFNKKNVENIEEILRGLI